MTKLKSKKMTKSTFAIIIMAIAMVAMLAFGGTYAYFTSAGPSGLSASTNLGRIEIDQTATALAKTSLVSNALPTQSIFGKDGTTLTIKDNSNRASFIFITVEATIATVKTKDAEGVATEWNTATPITLDGEGMKVGNVALTKPNGETGATYYILTTEGGTVGTAIDVTNINISIPENYGNEYQQAKITISFTVKSIQAEGFLTDADDAVDAAAALASYTENGIPA